MFLSTIFFVFFQLRFHYDLGNENRNFANQLWRWWVFSICHFIEHLVFFFFRLSVYGGISLLASEFTLSICVHSLLLCTQISETSSARFFAMKSRNLLRQVPRSFFLLFVLLHVAKTVFVYARSDCSLRSCNLISSSLHVDDRTFLSVHTQGARLYYFFVKMSLSALFISFCNHFISERTICHCI